LGVDRFEGPSILTNQVASAERCYIGETIQYQLGMVNAGKAAALLIKVDRLFPHGCELVGTTGRYRLEGGSLQLNGKKLDPFANEDLKFSVKMTKRGPVKLAPKISYLDEKDAYKTNEVGPKEHGRGIGYRWKAQGLQGPERLAIVTNNLSISSPQEETADGKSCTGLRSPWPCSP
jgi:hypothetical protein